MIVFEYIKEFRLQIKEKCWRRSFAEEEKVWRMTTPQEFEKMVSESFGEVYGRTLDWNNLRSYTEKMQWAKLYDLSDEKIECTDKYLVRDWVKKRIGEEYLVVLYGVYEYYKDIDFDILPNSFVIKTNHGAGDVCVIKDKKSLRLLDKMRIKRKIEHGLFEDMSHRFCEMHYSKIAPKIIIEEYIESEYEDLPDYKFLCFNGEPQYVWVDIGRSGDHRRNVYNLDWILQDWTQYYPNTDFDIPKPKNLKKMIELARVLSKGFSHVRVDLYNIEGRIYFGEMTFTNGGGMKYITSPEADLMLGQLWDLECGKEYAKED